MGDPQSYLQPSQLDRIKTAAGRGWATRVAIAGGTTTVVLARWDANAGSYATFPANVLVERADRQTQVATDDSGEAAIVYGYLSRPLPFNVKVGDLFSLPDGTSGRVVDVAAPRLGIVRAAWELRTGGG